MALPIAPNPSTMVSNRFIGAGRFDIEAGGRQVVLPKCLERQGVRGFDFALLGERCEGQMREAFGRFVGKGQIQQGFAMRDRLRQDEPHIRVVVVP